MSEIKKLKERTNELAKRISLNWGSKKKGIIDEINSELYSITNSLFYMLMEEKFKELYPGR